MTKADVAGFYDPVAERMYITGAIRVMIVCSLLPDDAMGLLDDVIDEMLIDAFKFGWMSRETAGKE